MSFDVYVELGDESIWCGNYTGNLGAFFAWALHGTEHENPSERCDSRDAIFGEAPRDGLQALDGMPCSLAFAHVMAALERIEQAPPGSLARFDAPNGWGTVEGATSFLRSCEGLFYEYPNYKVRVRW